ncbi:MAG: MBL fold metallo-hydrolase [Clostridia bacterium]|nr:MBL fold metallo-hydrolase [Clostridia bacterium]
MQNKGRRVELTIKVLAENTAISNEFLAEHGLSLYVETDNHNLLFDTGQSDLFFKNAQNMGVDLAKVDIVVISHGHYDHGGGLKTFMSQNSTAKIYINKNAFGDFYNSSDKYIGLDQSLKDSERIVLTDDEYKIDDELFLFSANKEERPFETQSNDLFASVNGKQEVDKFLHEQYLYITENSKKVLISGCSHKGILNIMNFTKELKPDALIGGFHFMKMELDVKGKKILDFTAEELLKYKTKYFTCHCTGVTQYEYLKKRMKEQISYISAGKSFEI